MRTWLWQGKPWQAFKNFAILFSLLVNLSLIVILLLVAPQIIPTVDQVGEPLVGGLNQSFRQMNQARIVDAIQVDDSLPISFTLPLEGPTVVVLTEPVPLSVGATFNLPGGGGSINGTVNLQLPAGLQLPVFLDLDVPVRQTIPVQLAVPVDIQLNQTDLGPPFGTLEALFTPLDGFVSGLPSSNGELFRRLGSGAPSRPDTAAPAHEPTTLSRE